MQRQGIIAAIASSVASCARIVIRVSGDGCHAILTTIAGPFPRFRAASRIWIKIDGIQLAVTALIFPPDSSYTGEESFELHIPGNPLLARIILEALYSCGAMPAEPGEFTARAFFNGRLNLTEAEGIAASISATNQRELEAARRLQSGQLTSSLRPIMDDLTELLSLLEAGIDFSEEDIRFITRIDLFTRSNHAVDKLRRLLVDSLRYEQLSHEPAIVLCGYPNAGKSTLLNVLAGRYRAVISPIAGTTRDLLWAEIELPRGIVKLIDTAGLEVEDVTENTGPMHEIRRQMHLKAMGAIDQADVVVLMHSANDARDLPLLLRQADILVRSKSDLTTVALPGAISISAADGSGIETLRKKLDKLSFGHLGGEKLALNARHRHQITLAISGLELISNDTDEELIAEHLRGAIDALGEITGLVSVEDVLGRIFSSFCIGK